MARAKRHFIPGHIWHIPHRCHKREFLLKFSKDRRRWLQWLFQAKRRYGLTILNYIVTSNHIHLSREAQDFASSTCVDDGYRDVIPRSVQLVAGRTGQEYNQRKGRPDKSGSSTKEHFGRIGTTQRRWKEGIIFFAALYILTSIWFAPV